MDSKENSSQAAGVKRQQVLYTILVDLCLLSLALLNVVYTSLLDVAELTHTTQDQVVLGLSLRSLAYCAAAHSSLASCATSAASVYSCVQCSFQSRAAAAAHVACASPLDACARDLAG